MGHTSAPWRISKENLIHASSPGFIEGTKEVCTVEKFNPDWKDNAKLIAAAPDLLKALLMITSNEHLCLDDLVYTVREREMEGWEGKSVAQWGQAIMAVKDAIKKATE